MSARAAVCCKAITAATLRPASFARLTCELMNRPFAALPLFASAPNAAETRARHVNAPPPAAELIPSPNAAAIPELDSSSAIIEKMMMARIASRPVLQAVRTCDPKLET